jgi:hypothetical protein
MHLQAKSDAKEHKPCCINFGNEPWSVLRSPQPMAPSFLPTCGLKLFWGEADVGRGGR